MAFPNQQLYSPFSSEFAPVSDLSAFRQLDGELNSVFLILQLLKNNKEEEWKELD
jgi:hypothetical protein